MAKLEAKTKEDPKLQQRTLSDGRISLYLEYYLGRKQWIDEETGKTKIKHHRKKESLNLYLLATPRTPKERQTNKETLELAKEIRAEREQELKKDRTGKRLFTAKGVNFLDYFQAYIMFISSKMGSRGIFVFLPSTIFVLTNGLCFASPSWLISA